MNIILRTVALFGVILAASESLSLALAWFLEIESVKLILAKIQIPHRLDLPIS
jgi:hypothetical protein